MAGCKQSLNSPSSNHWSSSDHLQTNFLYVVGLSTLTYSWHLSLKKWMWGWLIIRCKIHYFNYITYVCVLFFVFISINDTITRNILKRSTNSVQQIWLLSHHHRIRFSLINIQQLQYCVRNKPVVKIKLWFNIRWSSDDFVDLFRVHAENI